MTAATFTIEFPVQMIAAPTTINLYSVAGTIANVSGLVYSGSSSLLGATDFVVSTYWLKSDVSLNRVNYVGGQSNNSMYASNSGSFSIPQTGYIKYHATVDSRLGQ